MSRALIVVPNLRCPHYTGTADRSTATYMGVVNHFEYSCIFKMAAETVPSRCCCFDPDEWLIYPFGLQDGEHVLARVPVYTIACMSPMLLVPWCGLYVALPKTMVIVLLM